jgi:YHS domain-containing protein
MIRTVFYLLLAIFLITLLRYVIGTIGRGFAGLFQSSSPDPPKVEPAGELKRDPVCGVFVSTAASVKETVRGEVVHFCSAACRDKYKNT